MEESNDNIETEISKFTNKAWEMERENKNIQNK